MESSSRSISSKVGTILSAIACFFCLALLISVVALESTTISTWGTKTEEAPLSSQGMSSSPLTVSKVHSQGKLDPLYGNTKRRVPNGPDPIHNRRAGKASRTPGRV